MNLKQKKCVQERSLKDVDKFVIVAVKYSHEISRAALIWAFNHVIQPGNCVKLLVVVPPCSPSKKLWGFPKFHSDCAVVHGLSFLGTNLDQKEYITESCRKMMLGLHQFYDPNKIKMKIKVLSGSQPGSVAAEAKKDQTQWVILDKNMKKEAKCCMEQLECNVVVVKKPHPNVLRLNLTGSSEPEAETLRQQDTQQMKPIDEWNATQVPNVTPASSPEHSAFTSAEIGTSTSVSSFEQGCSPNHITDVDRYLKKNTSLHLKDNSFFEESDSDSDLERVSASYSSTSLSSQQWVSEILICAHEYSKSRKQGSLDFTKMLNPMFDSFLLKVAELDSKSDVLKDKDKQDIDIKTDNVRDIISLTSKAPSNPPPLCSICQHKAPVFGKPPRQFSFSELDNATDGFSQANFLAEGGYGSVHRGVLPDGQVVAVKQRKTASTQGDQEFCSEVEVLSCAQHRNVVLLIGFCVEDGKRLLVYEYICNSSLDSHLYGQNHSPLDWSARQKIAIGAARGLRYLHEECRVGCIVHRDVRPNNILLTHDFEPLVGDFGLARWQPDGDSSVETRIIGAFAPEYAQNGQVTENVDVYSFGVILIELVTGRKVVDLSRSKGQQFLIDWARPLLEECAVTELIDPRLSDCYSEQEINRMLRCASLCIQRDPLDRPRISQVLRMLEGDFQMGKT